MTAFTFATLTAFIYVYVKEKIHRYYQMLENYLILVQILTS